MLLTLDNPSTLASSNKITRKSRMVAAFLSSKQQCYNLNNNTHSIDQDRTKKIVSARDENPKIIMKDGKPKFASCIVYAKLIPVNYLPSE